MSDENITVRTVAEFLESFARKVDAETRRYPNLPIMTKTDSSWGGFVGDAEKLIKKLQSNVPPLSERAGER